MNNPFPRFEAQTPKVAGQVAGPPIAWSLAGTANSPSSSLTLMYQNIDSATMAGGHAPPPRQTSTPPGNMVYDPIRQSLPEASTSLLAPAFPHSNPPTVRQSPRPPMPRRHSNMSAASGPNRPTVKFDALPEDGDARELYAAPRFTPTSQQSNGYEGYSASPPSTMAAESGLPATTMSGTPHSTGTGSSQQMYYPQGGVSYMQWAPSMGNMDAITFDSQDIDIGALGLQQPELMGPWLEYIPGEVLGLFDNQDMGGQQGP